MEPNIKTKNDSLKEWLSLFYFILAALAIRIFIMELFFVPTGSMKLTILEHDYIFSTKYSYGYSKHSFPFSPNIFNGRILPASPQRGDIVIFRPPFNMDVRYVKRLIGLPGDKIQLINDIVYINDKPIHRKELENVKDTNGKEYKKFKETLPNGRSYFSYKLISNTDNRYNTTEVFYVPEDKYFFLGDNRDESRDSRVDLGYVPFENFIAKGQFIIFSTDQLLWLKEGDLSDRIKQIWFWISSIRWHRMFKSIYILE